MGTHLTERLTLIKQSYFTCTCICTKQGQVKHKFFYKSFNFMVCWEYNQIVKSP